MIEKMCKSCGRTYPVYNSAQSLCGVCSYNKYFRGKQKPISQRGKRTRDYEVWRDTVAIPHLTKQYGLRCSECGVLPSGKYHDVDHIKKRSTPPELKTEITNVRFLCRRCHQKRV